MIKSLLIFLIFLNSLLFSQISNKQIKSINNYCDSIDNLISNSSGFPGEIFRNTISSIRNVRAIGLQETKISFYYIQKEDSVYETGNNILFIPQYNPPVKIRIEYNIAASQNVTIDYYFDNDSLLCFYHNLSEGAYGKEETRYWFEKNNLLQVDTYNENDRIHTYKKSEKFSKDDLEDSVDIIENAAAYIEEYYNILEIEQIDKQ